MVEFLNKEESQNEVMSRVLKGNIKVEASIPENKTFESSVVSYGVLGNNIADSILYSDYLDTTNLAYDETVDNNLRYIGKNPNNYVDFNGEKWRIIGVMNNVLDSEGNSDSRIKLIREESIGNYAWDTSTGNINHNEGINEWSQADLMKLLNPGYENESVGGSLYWNRGSGNCYIKPNNETQSCNFLSTGLKDETKKYIDLIEWNTGSNGNADYTKILSSEFYTYERSNNTGKMCTSGAYCTDSVSRTTTWVGHIGLMYPSDYGFATTGGANTNRITCLNTPLYNWNTVSNCYSNNWLFKSMRTLTPSVIPYNSSALFDIWGNGQVSVGSGGTGISTYPVLYFKSNTSIISGTGTKEDSYKLK